MFVRNVFVAVVIAGLSAAVNATVYQCTVDGQTVFSDSPCGDDSKEVTVDPVTVGGQLDTGTDVETYEPPKREKKDSRSKCPYISSTELKRLIIKNQIKRGMKPDDVRRSWGKPSSVRTSQRTQWAYHYSGGSANYVYFENGCVVDWSGYYRN